MREFHNDPVLAAARSEFDIRLYRWALGEFEREVLYGYPLVSTVQNSATAAFLEFIEEIDRDGQLILAAGLVRQAHARAARRLGVEPSPSEVRLVKEYSAARLSTGALATQKKRVTGRTGVTKKKLRAAVERAFYTSFQWKGRDVGSAEVMRYVSTVHGWSISTYVDTGGVYDLRYHHAITTPSGAPLRDWISFLGLIGLGHARWELSSEADVPQAVGSFTQHCRKFIGALPILLEGLSAPPATPSARG